MVSSISVFTVKIVYAFLISLMRVSLPAHFIRVVSLLPKNKSMLVLILITFGSEYKL